MSIQRWDYFASNAGSGLAVIREDPNGAYVLHDDYVAALAEIRTNCGVHDQMAADVARADAIRECVAAVEDERVPWPTATGVLVNEGIDLALAALRALLPEDQA